MTSVEPKSMRKFEDLMVNVAPRRICPHERHDRRDDENDASGRLDLEKLEHRTSNPARQPPVAADPGQR